MTACLRSLGLVDSVGIDCTIPTRLNGPIIKLDLPQASHVELAKSLLTNQSCAYAHFAPPCGTSSRARLIQKSDQHMPPPLRNDQYPNGLPWLTKEQQERIDKANELYRVTCELITLCQRHKILWSCENPGRSFMWQTTPFVALFRTTPYDSIEMHHCMYGSSRRKLTRLIHNISSCRQLCQMCDNSHEHEPWGQKPDGSWATSEETAYPWPLARAIATQVVLQLQDQGVVCHLPSFAEQECTIQAMRAATNIQPRKNLPPMVPEFKQVSVRVHRPLCHSMPGDLALPNGGMSRVLKEITKTKSQ